MRPNTSGTALAIVGYLAIVYVATSASAVESDRYRYSMCAKMGRPNFAIGKKPFDGAANASAQTVHEKRVDLRFSSVIDLRGPLAHCVETLRGDLMHIRQQGDYRLTPEGYLRRHESLKLSPSSPYAAQPERTGPRFKGRTPSSVTALDFSPFGPERVGVWTDPGGSSIALFETGADGGTAPRVVGTTTARLRGISYFPAPDAPTGTITVIRDIAPDHVQIWVGELRTKPFVR